MRIIVPITGRVLKFDEKLAKKDGVGISGDSNDPVRLININLGNVSWRRVGPVDLENDTMEIEVTPAEKIAEPILDNDGNYTFDVDGNPKFYPPRIPTAIEKQQFLDDARAKIEGKSIDQLYAETGSPRLKKLKKHVDDFKKFKAGKTT